MAGKLFVTGDHHGHLDGRATIGSKAFPQGKELDRDDVVLVCGDFGYWWDNSKEDLYWQKWLSEKPFTIAAVDGNHENFPILEEHLTIEKWGSDVKQIQENVFWLRRGRVYDINGVSVFAFGGAESTDKQHRKAYIDWWPEEVPTYGEWMIGESSLEDRDWQVDVVLTHTLPRSLKDEALARLSEDRGYMREVNDTTEEMLQSFYDRTHFLAWFAGHFHGNMLMSDGKTRTLYRKVIDVKDLLMK